MLFKQYLVQKYMDPIALVSVKEVYDVPELY